MDSDITMDSYQGSYQNPQRYQDRSHAGPDHSPRSRKEGRSIAADHSYFDMKKKKIELYVSVKQGY